jgi:hypothetical protein
MLVKQRYKMVMSHGVEVRAVWKFEMLGWM